MTGVTADTSRKEKQLKNARAMCNGGRYQRLPKQFGRCEQFNNLDMTSNGARH